MENGVENIDRRSEMETKIVDVGSSQLSENPFQVLLEEEVAKGSDVAENGERTLSEAETKTGDGAISQLNLAENVVQVFVEEKDSEGDEVSEDVGTAKSKTEAKTADGGIAEVSLLDNVVQVFHDRKPSEGDDVFEEAIDSQPEDILAQEHQQKSDLDESSVNGVESMEKFEDMNTLEANGTTSGSQHAEKFEEANEVDLPSDDPGSEVDEQFVFEEKVEPNVARKTEQQRVDEIIDDAYRSVEAAIMDKRNDTVDTNVEEYVKGASSVNEDLDAKPLVDVKEEVKEVSSIDEKSKSVVYDDEDVKEVSSSVEDGETKPMRDVKDHDVIIQEKSENGDMDNKGYSHGNETSEQMLLQRQVEDAMESVKTSIHEEIDTTEVKNVTSDSVATEALEIKEVMGNQIAQVGRDSPTEIDGKIDSEGESEAEDCQPQVGRTSETPEEGSNIKAMVEKPKELSMGNNQEKDVSVVKELGESSMENGDAGRSIVKELDDSSLANEIRVQPAADPNPAPHPAGLGRAAPLLEPARVPQQSRVNGAVPQRQTQLVEDPMNGEAEENDETREKLQMIRVKFLRLAHRLGQTPHNVVVAQVLYRLGLAEQLRGRNTGRSGAFSFDRASAMAEQLEAAGQEPLDFSCTIMVLGKSGVGKSATINSIFDEVKFGTDAFQVSTKKVQDVVGTVQGIKVRIIDTPGLLPCWSDQRKNEKILQSVKQFIKKNPPDIVLYLDRLDMQTRDFGDMPVLRTITEIFGPSIWFNAIVVLTHAASAPPDGPNGIASSYEMFITQRSHAVQQAIRQAAGDMRLMNPVSLVENHSACRTNRAGQRVLPNGQVWKPHLLLLSFASKILAEANTLLKLQDNPPGKAVAPRSRAPPLPYLLSSLLQSRAQVKLPEEQAGGEDDLDDDLDDSSDSDDEYEYDELPPFKPLTKAQLASLSKAQKKAYYDEVEYRENLFMKKQLKEEKKRRKLLKKLRESAKDYPTDYNENAEEDGGGPANVPVAMPDFSLPSSFDSDNPSHRYRFLDSGNQWLIRPVLETHGWDHDVGYEGINVERLFAIKEKIPLSFSGQVTKDKKECNLQMEVTSSLKHGEGKGTSLGFDMQTMGKDISYTLRSDTRFINYRRNKTAAGIAVTLLGDTLTAGLKLEDQLLVNKRFKLVMTGGAMSGRGDVAYGGSLEATLRDKDFPLGRSLSTLGLSIMDWHGDLAIGCNIQSQIPVGRSTNLIARANLNNRGSGQLSIRLNSSEHLQLAMVGLLPLLRKIQNMYQQRQREE